MYRLPHVHWCTHEELQSGLDIGAVSRMARSRFPPDAGMVDQKLTREDVQPVGQRAHEYSMGRSMRNAAHTCHVFVSLAAKMGDETFFARVRSVCC